ncbi:hypothetical protein VO56_01280 [Mycoplasmopsis gallinacea]|uniref:Uncharacterized protein n=1 Tax=Mycoplasmopsis gallinacea TaxID=29556 RepID=A0A0D5ZIZ3_9BACT|nr:hypothetical protein VO56_01280 [Mycoplasmopsis gallinacea]
MLLKNKTINIINLSAFILLLVPIILLIIGTLGFGDGFENKGYFATFLVGCFAFILYTFLIYLKISLNKKLNNDKFSFQEFITPRFNLNYKNKINEIRVIKLLTARFMFRLFLVLMFFGVMFLSFWILNKLIPISSINVPNDYIEGYSRTKAIPVDWENNWHFYLSMFVSLFTSSLIPLFTLVYLLKGGQKLELFKKDKRHIDLLLFAMLFLLMSITFVAIGFCFAIKNQYSWFKVEWLPVWSIVLITIFGVLSVFFAIWSIIVKIHSSNSNKRELLK